MSQQPTATTLRLWQRRALTKYLSTKPRDFLAVATPGAGKTTFALRVATELLMDRTVDQIIVVAPTDHLKHQWAGAAQRVGISLDSRFSNTSSGITSDVDGIVVTYAQVGMHPSRHRAITQSRRTLVILDEIHHGGDQKMWGEGIREAYEPATRRLSLTGTPFRSDDSPIPFVNYETNEDKCLQSKADHTYGYADALADGVVRPVMFLAYSGEAQWRNSAGEEYTARLGEPLNPEQTSRAWRTALDPRGDWMHMVLSAADVRLHKLRADGMHDAGGLIIASDQESARAYANLIYDITGRRPTLVLSDDSGASDSIARFANNTDEWMVAVRMVSEGVDIPRLAVGVYATSASTPLYFAQAIGRFVRSRGRAETASIFLPSVPVLLDLASKLETERDHILGKPHRESGFEDELLAQARKQHDNPDYDPLTYETIGTEAELDHVIYEGSTYGTNAYAGSAEEQEYLGLPGLLDTDQMRLLLRRREKEQLSRPVSTQNTHAEVTAHRSSVEERNQLRKELNALVAITSRRHNKPHAEIHSQLRAACGGPAVALATVDQLKQRIDQLRQW